MPLMPKALNYVRDLLTDFEKLIAPDKLPMNTDKIMKTTNQILKQCIYDDNYIVNKKNLIKIRETDCDFQKVS